MEGIFEKTNNDSYNNGGTTIYKTELNLKNEQEKSRPNSDEFKQLLYGGVYDSKLVLIFFDICITSVVCFFKFL